MAPLKLQGRSIAVQAEELTKPASLKSKDCYCLLLKIKEWIANEEREKHWKNKEIYIKNKYIDTYRKRENKLRMKNISIIFSKKSWQTKFNQS